MGWKVYGWCQERERHGEVSITIHRCDPCSNPLRCLWTCVCVIYALVVVMLVVCGAFWNMSDHPGNGAGAVVRRSEVDKTIGTMGK